jgi:hypothetical protein
MSNKEVKRIDEVLENAKIEWTTLNVYLMKKGYTVCNSESLQKLKDAHYEEVGSDGWRNEFNL